MGDDDSDNTRYIHKLRKLEKQAGSLPVLFALFFQHSISQLISYISGPVPNWLVYLICASVVGWVYVKEISGKDISEAAKETSEKVKDAVSDTRQSKIDEY